MILIIWYIRNYIKVVKNRYDLHIVTKIWVVAHAWNNDWFKGTTNKCLCKAFPQVTRTASICLWNCTGSMNIVPLKHTLYQQKYINTWLSYPYTGFPPAVATKIKTQEFTMSFYAMKIRFPFIGTKWPKPVSAWRCPCA